MEGFRGGQFNYASEMSVQLLLPWKLKSANMHTIFTTNPLKCTIVPDFCTKLGVLEVNQFHCDSSFYTPTLVVMVTKIW